MHDITLLIEQYGVIVVFISVLLDLLGLPIPSYPALVIAGALSVSGGASAGSIIGASLLAALIADLIWYVAGVRLGSRVLTFLCRFTLSPDGCVRNTQRVFARMGAWSLLFTKFVPGLGYVSVALSGVTRLSLPLFLLADGIGDLLYVALPVLLGRLFHSAVDSVLSVLVRLGEIGLVLVIGLLLLYILARWVERAAFARRLRM